MNKALKTSSNKFYRKYHAIAWSELLKQPKVMIFPTILDPIRFDIRFMKQDYELINGESERVKE